MVVEAVGYLNRSDTVSELVLDSGHTVHLLYMGIDYLKINLLFVYGFTQYPFNEGFKMH